MALRMVVAKEVESAAYAGKDDKGNVLLFGRNPAIHPDYELFRFKLSCGHEIEYRDPKPVQQMGTMIELDCQKCDVQQTAAVDVSSGAKTQPGSKAVK